MALADLARSHVKECLRESLELSTVFVDSDGDVPIAHGTAIYWVAVRSDGKYVKAWSRPVVGVKQTAALMREVNEVNMGLEHSRLFFAKGMLMLEGVLPVDGLTPEYLHDLCVEVGATADDVGQMISAVYGGEVARPDGDGSCEQCGG